MNANKRWMLCCTATALWCMLRAGTSAALITPMIQTSRRTKLHAAKNSQLERIKEEKSPSFLTKRRLKVPFFKSKSSQNNNNNNNNYNHNNNDPTSNVVTDVHSLREIVINSKVPLSSVTLNLTHNNNNHNHHHSLNATTISSSPLLQNHEVIKLISKRLATNSTPGNRAPTDQSHLALAIEGGGMRGAVSAGMAAAIASLGLVDTFDSIYGSSAGSIVGAYMVSRQMCVDVYTEVLPAAGERFASKKRVIGNLVVGVGKDVIGKRVAAAAAAARERDQNITLLSNSQNDDSNKPPKKSLLQSLKLTNSRTRLTKLLFSKAVTNSTLFSSTLPQIRTFLKDNIESITTLNPGMNISFIIDGIMDETHGLRPFDILAFQQNDKKQPLYVVASAVRGDIREGKSKMETICFSSREFDFWEEQEKGESVVLVQPKRGLIVRTILKTGRIVKHVLKFPVRLVRRIIFTASFNTTTAPLTNNTTRRGHTISTSKDFDKNGFFACLAASMLVPGAAGPPIGLLRSKHRNDYITHHTNNTSPFSSFLEEEENINNNVSMCFDAFCYEPIPYRSAVQNNATHVLALRSRPDGCDIPTKPGLYEKVVAPVYFRLNGLPQVGEYFENGGQQYRYLEDVLTLDDGLIKGCGAGAGAGAGGRVSSKEDEDFTKGIPIPPTDILYGTPDSSTTKKYANISKWKRAHLLPLVLPYGSPELPTLNQDKNDVTDSVRLGYATAFDMLAPTVGLRYDKSRIDGAKMAELLFPKAVDGDNGGNGLSNNGGGEENGSIQKSALERPVRVKGDIIEDYNTAYNNNNNGRRGEAAAQEERIRRSKFVAWVRNKRIRRRRDKAREAAGKDLIRTAAVEVEKISSELETYVEDQDIFWLEAEALLAALPGFRRGKLSHLSGALLNGGSGGGGGGGDGNSMYV